MAKFKTEINGHQIDIFASRWSGRETVSCDGEVKSSFRNIKTVVGVHHFEADEDGEKAVYEVNVIGGILGFGYAIRRNGIIVKHQP